MRHRGKLAGLAVFLACGLIAGLAFTHGSGGARGEIPPVPPDRRVRVQTVVLTNPTPALTYSGTVQARRLATLGFRVGGKVVERRVDVGDHVRAGQVLARIDPADLSLSLQAAESAVIAAEADDVNARNYLARYQGLGSSSPAFVASELDKRLADARTADARLDQARRQFALARDQLAYATLSADVDGVITALPVEVGQVVTAGQPIAVLAHSAETEILVDVPENRLAQIRGASNVTVRLWAAPDRVFDARVREIGSQADPGSRTFAVKVTVLDPPPGLLALGMTAVVRFGLPASAPVVILPAGALADRDGQPAVWVVDAARHRAALRSVTVAGMAGDGTIAIASGLSEGEQVVTAGATALDADLPVVAWTGAER